MASLAAPLNTCGVEGGEICHLIASAKQIASNLNAASTGPRTFSGKKRASMDAVRHGLCVAGAPEASLDLDSLFDRMTRSESERASLFQPTEQVAKKGR